MMREYRRSTCCGHSTSLVIRDNPQEIYQEGRAIVCASRSVRGTTNSKAETAKPVLGLPGVKIRVCKGNRMLVVRILGPLGSFGPSLPAVLELSEIVKQGAGLHGSLNLPRVETVSLLQSLLYKTFIPTISSDTLRRFLGNS